MSNPYDYAIDPNGNDTANKVLRLVKNGSNVLELGTAAGVMTRELHRGSCRVTGIEFVPEMAEQAGQWCTAMHVGDLDTFDFAGLEGIEQFDYIVAADVLEHLRNPRQVLARLKSVVGDQARLVVSVPNVTYAGLVAGLSQGSFRYREKGLLDQTHLRFFSRASLEWMLLESGWVPIAWDAHRVRVDQSEFVADWMRVTVEQRANFSAQPDADVYQFIVLAAPACEAGFAQRYDQAVARLEDALEAEQRTHLARITAHERDLASLLEHQKAFGEAKEIIAGLQVEVAGLQGQVFELEEDRRPVWLEVSDRRVLCVLARWFYRLAWRLGSGACR